MLLLSILTAIFLPSFAQAVQTDWNIDTFHSQLSVLSDGLLDVTETISADYHSNPHHGIYRDLPYKYSVDGNDRYMNFTVVNVLRDSETEPYSVTQNGANLRIKIGNPDQTIIGSHQYTIHYTVKGALSTFADFDELNWNVTGHEWEVPIESASATVSLPKDAIVQSSCYTGPPGSTASECHKTNDSHRQISFQTNDSIELGNDFSVAVGFNGGLVPLLVGSAPPTPWTNPKTYSLALGIALLSFGLLVRYWWKSGRDEYFNRTNLHDEHAQVSVLPLLTQQEAITPQYEPPSNLLPAEMAVILTEKSTPAGISATIVDLAVRGYLTVTELPKHWFGGRDYTLTKTKKSHDLLKTYEANLLGAIFFNKKNTTLSSLKNDTVFGDKIRRIHDRIYTDVTDLGAFALDPEKQRNAFRLKASVIPLTVFFLYFLIPYLGSDLSFIINAWLGAGVVLGALAAFVLMLIFSGLMPKRSAVGREMYQQSLGYKMFLTNTEKYRQPFLEQQGLFMKVLPYAMIFGVTKQLLQAMATIGVTISQPSWYIGTTNWSSLNFASDMSNLTTTVSSMSSSSASSGGGSSGGGGGGGGGGGW